MKNTPFVPQLTSRLVRLWKSAFSNAVNIPESMLEKWLARWDWGRGTGLGFQGESVFKITAI